MKPKRWQSLMKSFGLAENQSTYKDLVAAYSENHRRYHTVEHVSACLKYFDRCKKYSVEPEEIELALWFHDAIYRPFSNHNEKDSAEWAERFLRSRAVEEAKIARIYRLIMVTEHNAPTQTKDESILVDIDLSILGSSPEHYAEFESAVRFEYRKVPMLIYKKKRIEILSGFLAKQKIYQNEPFASLLEGQARINLAGAISQLRSGRR